MATLVITTRAETKVEFSDIAEWESVAAGWSETSWDGDSGVVSTASVGANNADGYVDIGGGLYDDGTIPQNATVDQIDFSFDWSITAPSGNSGNILGPFDTDTWSGDTSGTSSGSISIQDTWANYIAAFASGSIAWSFQRDNSAQSGGDIRIVISNFTITVTYHGGTPPPPPPPTASLDTIQPTQGASTGGDTVTLRGHGFTASSVPTFDGIAATNVVIVSALTLTCSPPPHAIGSVDVVVAGCGTLTNGFRYVARASDTNVIIAGSAPNLPPIPAQQPPVDPRTSRIDSSWLRWLNTLKQRVEAVVGADASQIVSGLFKVAQIPTLPWSKIDKSGSSLADLETRNAGDLVEGMLPVLRLPPLTGDVLSDRGSNDVEVVGILGTDLTTIAKGDVIAGTDTGEVGLVNVGTDGQVLTADAASTGGVKWADAASAAAMAQVYRATNQTLTHGTEAAISLSNASVDTDSFWSSSDPTRLTAPTDGAYTFTGQIQLGTGFKGVVQLALYVNGTLAAAETHVGADVASGSESHAITRTLNLSATDYVEFKVTLTLSAGSGTFDVVGGSAATFFEAVGGNASGAPAGGITELTGDVTAGPGTGSTPATLAASGVTAATYGDATHVAQITVDEKGRITAASDVAITGGGGSGALVLLEQHTAASSASLDFTSFISSAHDEYLIELINVIPATNGADLRFRVSTDSGVSFDSSANYYYGIWGTPNSGAAAAVQGNSATSAAVFTSLSNTREGVSGTMRLFNPLGSGLHRSWILSVVAWQAGAVYGGSGMGLWNLTTPVDACQFLYSSGNIASGTIRAYGVAK